MIRGRTGDDGDLEFFDDQAPGTVVGAVTREGITGAAGGDVTAADITDATATGRSVLTAASAAAARSAIGAGTSSVALAGSGTATTGAHSDHTHAAPAVPTASQVTASAISPGSATTVQGILAELAARISTLEAG
ncbi:hypothetical protein [Streptomyces tremellae]|uniref:Uncharacterized protein n=1 Tax=Streptomyces tremellae TaxID=1124239 RepID=A0ABP7EHX5_9ACTN